MGKKLWKSRHIRFYFSWRITVIFFFEPGGFKFNIFDISTCINNASAHLAFHRRLIDWQVEGGNTNLLADEPTGFTSAVRRPSGSLEWCTSKSTVYLKPSVLPACNFPNFHRSIGPVETGRVKQSGREKITYTCVSKYMIRTGEQEKKKNEKRKRPTRKLKR